MLYWNKYIAPSKKLEGKKKKFDNNIYTFDIETTSYIVLDNIVYPAIKYNELDDKEKERCIKKSLMYIWQFGINDIVYYGRTWDELKSFLFLINKDIPEKKYLFIHNQAFEFQFFKSVLKVEDVMARKSHKVMTSFLPDYNFIVKCSYFMSNSSLENLPKVFNLPVKKLVGDLDYNLIRTPKTPLTDEEMGYCENDILVLYHYILRELETYETVKNIPTTSTGKVRRELQDLTRTNFKYKRLVNKAINTDPHVYNLLMDCFAGGYTHSNYIYTDEILDNIDSYDETSAYPYVLTAFKFPSSEFRPCRARSKEELNPDLCYILRVKFKHIRSKYYNTFLSMSKCRFIKGGRYDNGRIIEAEELETTITDVDFYFLLDAYDLEYEILECYWANKRLLPRTFINFVLDKYVAKTKLKNVEGKEVEYSKEKNKFNALYGMSVTNTIRDEVKYDNELGIWEEIPLTNDEIKEKLEKEKKKSFLSFAWGVWVTAYARDNLLRRVLELDDYTVYCDTDSIKLVEGYYKEIFKKYNETVIERLKAVSDTLNIDYDRFSPEDIKGESHTLGVFESETDKGRLHTYDKFITQGAKKYAVQIEDKIKITVAGVPKKAGKTLKRLEDFKDNYVFEFKDTNKLLIVYIDDMDKQKITDYLGIEYEATDKTGCCLLPTTYVLGKAIEYANLISDDSSPRARFKE